MKIVRRFPCLASLVAQQQPAQLHTSGPSGGCGVDLALARDPKRRATRRGHVQSLGCLPKDVSAT